MSLRARIMPGLAAVAVSLVPAALPAQPAPAAAAPKAAAPAGEANLAAPLFNEKCSGCHGVDTVAAQRHSPAEWKAIVEQMVNNGLDVSGDEKAKILAYLSANFG